MATKNTKRKKKNQRKAKNLVFILGITVIVFVVATYAWFIGLSEVTINTFNVEIKASDGLSLSLNGQTWSTELNLGATTKDILANVLNGSSTTITDDSAPELAYVGNENYWLGVDTAAFAALENPTDLDVTNLISELVPLSTYGELNTNSKLRFYSKSSMTASSGGYNLRADELARKLIDEESGETSDIPEEKGYIAFDLFVKNKVTGGVYDGAFNLNNDEAVYLTTGSKVGLTAASSASKGLENSLRIAFMEIGRMSQTAEASAVTGMMCDSEGDGITVLCNKVNDPESANPNAPTAKTDVDASRGITYNIWEPNDTIHTPQSTKKFETQCRKRGTDGAYTTTKCAGFGTVAAGEDYVPTYVVYQPIGVDDKVDIYDGHNDYTDTIGVSGKPLKQVDYYTDTERVQNDGLRPQIFGLASSSITKFRVYIYLEGQDVDNFDISSDDGDAFEIVIGFTKDRYDTAPAADDDEGSGESTP